MLAQKFSYITTDSTMQKEARSSAPEKQKNKKFRYIELGSSGKKPQAVHRGYMDDVNIEQAQKFSYITTGSAVQKRPEVQHQSSKKTRSLGT